MMALMREIFPRKMLKTYWISQRHFFNGLLQSRNDSNGPRRVAKNDASQRRSRREKSKPSDTASPNASPRPPPQSHLARPSRIKKLPGRLKRSVPRKLSKRCPRGEATAIALEMPC
jgi:hypothetical protein